MQEKENQKQYVKRKTSAYSNSYFDDTDSYFKKCEGNSKLDHNFDSSGYPGFRCRANRSCSTYKGGLNSSRKSSSNKLVSDNEEDIHFLEAERQAQEAFLDDPIKLFDLRSNNNTELKNLMNVINNEIINKKTINTKKNINGKYTKLF